MQSAVFSPVPFLSRSGWREKYGRSEHGTLPWGTVAAWSVGAWSLAQPVNRFWSGSAMYNSIMQPFHGQRTPTVLIQTAPKGQTDWRAEVEDFILSNVLFNLKLYAWIYDIRKNTWKTNIKYKTKTQAWLCVFIQKQIRIIYLKSTILQVLHIV